MDTEDKGMELSADQGRVLLALARATIGAQLGLNGDEERKVPDSNLADPAFREKRGTFVTLKIGSQLRGCMGCLTPTETILEGIRRNALNGAFHDPRFPPLSGEELARTTIEISILTSPQKLAYGAGNELPDLLRPGIDGVIISKGLARATFLPQVWEQLPAGAEFLSHLCQKAGLPPDEWKRGELDVSIYQVQHFHEEG
jgi:AmmeMemoRadiSam system protein A